MFNDRHELLTHATKLINDIKHIFPGNRALLRICAVIILEGIKNKICIITKLHSKTDLLYQFEISNITASGTKTIKGHHSKAAFYFLLDPIREICNDELSFIQQLYCSVLFGWLHNERFNNITIVIPSKARKLVLRRNIQRTLHT